MANADQPARLDLRGLNRRGQTPRARQETASAIAEVRHETLHEGTSAQVLHLGSYDDEGPILSRLHDDWLGANNLQMSGLHHEIYLSDARKTDPAKLKTVLRQPVKPAE